jgi:hypothetical protein
MDQSITLEQQYTLEFEGHSLPVQLELEFDVTVDSDYGADADGNRGETRYGAVCMAVTVLDGSGQDLTERLAMDHPKQFNDIMELSESVELIDRAITIAKEGL